MTTTEDWHEFVEDDLETHPRDGAEIVVEFSNGTSAQARYRSGAPLTLLTARPDGVGVIAEVRRWRYLKRA